MSFGGTSFRAQRRRQLRRRLIRRGDAQPALVLDEVTAALGRQPENDARDRMADVVAVVEIVGTVARPQAFDRAFRPRRAHLRERWEQQADSSVTARGPVDLVRVGEVFFVEDGHHRVSVARARGQRFIDAAVRSLCTVAFAPGDLDIRQLETKAAEREFLRAVPVPDPELRTLRLDEAAAYSRLAAAARAWSDSHGLTSPRPGCVIDTAVAGAWWRHEVVPRGGPAVVARSAG